MIKGFKDNILNKISSQGFSASWAISSEYHTIEKSFEDIGDKYIRERLTDIKQMIISLLELLQTGEKKIYSTVKILKTK